MADEESTLGGRARRYLRVGATVGGLAARLAGERYLGLGFDKLEHAQDLKVALGGLKGPLMKVAQILSTIPNALPAGYAEQLGELQSHAPAMGWPFVRRRMARELGPDWEAKFAFFSHEAAAAASLGQVHRATDHAGRALACKLQYSDMSSVVEADLKQLNLVFSIYRRYDNAIDPREIHKELSARLREELDYRREAKQMQLYGAMLAGEPNVHVSEVVGDLCGDRLLSMTWLDGMPMLDWIAAHPSAEDRNRVALNMFRAWYVPLYYYGVIHGDPHLGNYTVRDDGAINLMDFGCIRAFRPSFVRGVIDLYKAIRDDDPALAVHAYETWGFKDHAGLDRYPQSMGALRLCAAAGGSRAADSGATLRSRRSSDRQYPQRTRPYRRGDAAAGIRADGPRRHRAGLGLHPPQGRGQLAPPVPRPDRRFR